MPQTIKCKKFKDPEVEEYMLGKYFSQWEGIKPAEKARWRIKAVANDRDKRDFDTFSGFRFENIEGTKNQHSIRMADNGVAFLFEKM